MHQLINSVVIAIVALGCLMNAMNSKNIMNVIEAQNKVMLQMATEINELRTP